MPTSNDTDLIESAPEPLVLSTGTEVLVERLKTRQLMRLMKILTRGAGAALTDLNFDDSTSQDDFVAQLVMTVVFSIPEAEDETIDFVRSMVSPAGLIVGRGLSKNENEINASKFEALDADFDNPELEDLVSVIEAVARNERDHLTALGKRLAVLLKTQQKTQAVSQPKASSKSKSARSTQTDS